MKQTKMGKTGGKTGKLGTRYIRDRKNKRRHTRTNTKHNNHNNKRGRCLRVPCQAKNRKQAKHTKNSTTTTNKQQPFNPTNTSAIQLLHYSYLLLILQKTAILSMYESRAEEAKNVCTIVRPTPTNTCVMHWYIQDLLQHLQGVFQIIFSVLVCPSRLNCSL